MRCKQGDLAVIVNVIDKRFSENIGKIVRCVRLWGEAEMYGWVWEIESQGQPIKVINSETKTWGYDMQALHSDENLRPIRGEKEVRAEEIFIPIEEKK